MVRDVIFGREACQPRAASPTRTMMPAAIQNPRPGPPRPRTAFFAMNAPALKPLVCSERKRDYSTVSNACPLWPSRHAPCIVGPHGLDQNVFQIHFLIYAYLRRIRV